MNPAVSLLASPSGLSPNPLMWEWGAMREDRFGDRAVVDKGALCAGGGAPDVDAFMVIAEEGRVEVCAVLHFSRYYLPIRAS